MNECMIWGKKRGRERERENRFVKERERSCDERWETICSVFIVYNTTPESSPTRISSIPLFVWIRI